MDKKKILIGLGVIALIGGIYYFYNKSKTAETEKSGGESTDSTDSKKVETPAISTPTASTPPTEPVKVLETRKERRKACGIEPKKITGILTGGVAMINFKKRKAKWQACIDAGGVASFEGDFTDYIDFEGQSDSQFMFSEVGSGLNLDL